MMYHRLRIHHWYQVERILGPIKEVPNVPMFYFHLIIWNLTLEKSNHVSSYDKAPIVPPPSFPLGGATVKTEKTRLAPVQPNSNQKTPISKLYEVFTKEYVTFKEVRSVFNSLSDWPLTLTNQKVYLKSFKARDLMPVLLPEYNPVLTSVSHRITLVLQRFYLYPMGHNGWVWDEIKNRPNTMLRRNV